MAGWVYPLAPGLQVSSLQSPVPVQRCSAAAQCALARPGVQSRLHSMRLPHRWHGPTSNAAQAPGRQQGVAHRIRRHLFRPLLELNPCCDRVDQMEPPHDGRWAIAEKSPFCGCLDDLTAYLARLEPGSHAGRLGSLFSSGWAVESSVQQRSGAQQLVLKSAGKR